MSAPLPSQIPQIRSTLRFYRVSSYITGVFLLLLMVTWGIRRLPFLGFDLWLMGPNGFITFESYGVEGEGLPTTGINLTVLILIVELRITSISANAASRLPPLLQIINSSSCGFFLITKF